MLIFLQKKLDTNITQTDLQFMQNKTMQSCILGEEKTIFER